MAVHSGLLPTACVQRRSLFLSNPTLELGLKGGFKRNYVWYRVTRLASKRRGKKMDSRLTRLYGAAHDGNVDVLKQLLAEDPLLLDRTTITTEIIDNPLHIACVLGHAGFAKEILHLRPNLAGEFNGQGLTPLHLAASQGHLAVVLELIQANIHACRIRESKDGYMPVHAAVIKGRVDVASVLLQRCEDTLFEVTHRRETLLHLAIKAYSIEAVNFLTTRDQTLINAQDHRGNTCLHLAVARRQQQVITHLLNFGITDINAVNSVGLTPLDVLLETTQETGDVFIGDMLGRAGGRTAAEFDPRLGNNVNTAQPALVPNQNQQTAAISKRSTRMLTNADERSTDNIIVVAALVAAVTYQAIFNPPGGSIQMPFEKSDGNFTNSPSWYSDWQHFPNHYPVGKPALLWSLGPFILANSVALLLSSITILIVLSGVHRKSKPVMIIVVWCLWFSVISMLVAFTCAFSKVYYYRYKGRTEWFVVRYLLYIAMWIGAVAGLLQAYRAALVGPDKVESLLSKFRWWPKVKNSFQWIMIITIIIIYYIAVAAAVVGLIMLLNLATKEM